MPIKAAHYPTNWKTKIRPDILNRAQNARGLEQCECNGECGKHPGRAAMKSITDYPGTP